MMKSQRLLTTTTLALMIASASGLVFANPVYQSFVVTPDQLGQAASADYRRCVTFAGVNTASRSQCDVFEQRLVDRRLDVSYRMSLASLSGETARAFRIGQQIWARGRDRDCENASRKLYNKLDIDHYVIQLRRCVLDESFRRTLWLEQR